MLPRTGVLPALLGECPYEGEEAEEEKEMALETAETTKGRKYTWEALVSLRPRSPLAGWLADLYGLIAQSSASQRPAATQRAEEDQRVRVERFSHLVL